MMDKYSLEEVKAYFQSLDSEILKRELFEHMSKDPNKDHLKCPFCGSQKVHKLRFLMEELQKGCESYLIVNEVIMH